MTDFPIYGGCICGSVRYKIKGPTRCVVHCHCSQCRHSYASLVGTGATIEKDQVEVVKGKDNLTTYVFSPEVQRLFCKTCGCSILYYDATLPDMVFYFPSTLDDGVHPGHPDDNEHHVHMDSKAHWENFSDDLPNHAADAGPGYLGPKAT